LKRALHLGLKLLAATLLALLLLAGALWLYSGADSSLASLMRQLQRILPAGQTLVFDGVSGTLRSGGRIDLLRWEGGGLSVEARKLQVSWSLRPLFDGQLHLSQLAAESVRIEDRRSPATPATAPTDLGLPLQVNATFSVATLTWAGQPELSATGVTGHYVFDHGLHRLDQGRAQIASGRYQLNASLQASAPLALSLHVAGQVQTRLPSSPQPLDLSAQASISGNLAGANATLTVQAQLAPTPATAAANRSHATGGQLNATQAQVSAQIHPWQAQPIDQALARWQALDLAAVWPQAPQTGLNGEASVMPTATGWRTDVTLSNSLSGPWNQQRLPLESLSAELNYRQGQWQARSLQAKGAGGSLGAQGTFTPAGSTTARAWQGSATLRGINPAALDSRLAATELDGEISARQLATGLSFEARLQSTARPGRARPETKGQRLLAALRLQKLHAQGRWQAPLLSLDALQIETDDAQLQGQISVNWISLATQGRLNLNLPGAQAQVNGTLASQQGQGMLALQLSDTQAAARWLARWPGTPASINLTALQGNAELTGRWQGGWHDQGQLLQIEAKLNAPKLVIDAAPGTANAPPVPGWRLREVQAQLAGTLQAFSLGLQGQADKEQRHFTLQAQSHGGRGVNGQWQTRLERAQLSTQNGLQPGLWTLQLNDPVMIQWQPGGATPALDVAAGGASLSGPVAGSAVLRWQAARWAQSAMRSDWHSQGRVVGLPLAWLDAIGQTTLANLGLHGDMLFDGDWDASSGDRLRLRANLERASGDLLLQTGVVGTERVSAGVRVARLALNSDGERVSASLRWDSERAGSVQADVSSRLHYQAKQWSWPLDAPLAGSVKVQLPAVGAWSLLAPPGWRMSGTLDASAMLSGTRSLPQWHGTLQAQDLALRSVVDGIDFSHGTLHASLSGQQLVLDEFSLQGAGGDDAGKLSVKGTLDWLSPNPANATTQQLATHLRMALTAQAHALRVSARADRRLIVSGELKAQVHDAHLRVEGVLKVNSALLTLPKTTAPQLGDDVVLRPTGEARDRNATLPTRPAISTVRVLPELAVTLDLGDDFQVSGRGINTRMSGKVLLRTSAGDATPHLTGTVRALRGTYLAYGQRLEIEQGVLQFNGSFDNPALDILALRPKLTQRVGVQISGTALSPVVRLYAEPDLPEAEKLAWLMLGRSASTGGDEVALLQQAALALLSKNGQGPSASLTQALGLDELSFRGRTSNASATTSTSAATVMLGKRLSNDFYVAYESSLAGSMGVFYIFYDLSRRLTLRAQTGEQSALDLIFTQRYD
jgi:translocation and assembly module TamB